jgi:hypothetical protein
MQLHINPRTQCFYASLSSGSVAPFLLLRIIEHLEILLVNTMICFQGAQYPKDVIVYAVFFYVRDGDLGGHPLHIDILVAGR